MGFKGPPVSGSEDMNKETVLLLPVRSLSNSGGGMHVNWRPHYGCPGWCHPLLPGEAKGHPPYPAPPSLRWICLAYSAYMFRLNSSTTNRVEHSGYGASPRAALQHHVEQSKYILGMVNSNTVNLKFHLIRSVFEIFARFLAFHV